MQIHKRINCTKFNDRTIDPRFVIIHYTGGSYHRIKSVFEDNEHEVSSHFVIDLDGSIDGVVPCLDGKCPRAWHAGKSKWTDENGQTWQDLNTHSIGIELVNLNGNIVEYPRGQIESLIELCRLIMNVYPDINSPHRFIGHEHISASRGQDEHGNVQRGKVDPGICFPWDILYRNLFPGADNLPVRTPICPPELAEQYKKFLMCSPADGTTEEHHNFWHAVNATMEMSIGLLNQQVKH